MVAVGMAASSASHVTRGLLSQAVSSQHSPAGARIETHLCHVTAPLSRAVTSPAGTVHLRSPASRCTGNTTRDVSVLRHSHQAMDRTPLMQRQRTLSLRVEASTASAGEAHKIGSRYAGVVPLPELLAAAEVAARKGAEVVLAAVDKPRSITYKGATDLVTETDKNAEAAILAEVQARFPEHLILGEEGGVTGNADSDYLWCIDPLDGTTNFAHGYPSFAVSVGVLFRGRPAAAALVEFAGGPFCWVTRTFTASSGGGAFCNGVPIHVSNTDQIQRSLFVTGFGNEVNEARAANYELFKHYTDVSRGVRRLGAAAVDLCHVALGVVEGYWEFRLKPWDMCAGVLLVEEAGGTVTRIDGGPFNVFERSVLVSNGVLHSQLLEKIAPPTKDMISKGFDNSQWLKPAGYKSEV